MANQFTHPWKREEIVFLINNFDKLPYKELGRRINKSYASVQSKIRNAKLNKRINKHPINSNFFKVWSSEMAYIIGFITADGNLQRAKQGYHLHIACDDYDIIEKMKKSLQSSTPIRKKMRFNGKISYSLRFSDKLIFKDLMRLGVTPRKSLTIKPPSMPKKYVWDYIRGFFDGDGCVYISKATPYPSKLHTLFYTGSLHMAQFLLRTINQYLKKYEGNIMKKKDKNAYVLHFGQKHSEVIFHYMYDRATIFMDRKYNIFLKVIA